MRASKQPAQLSYRSMAAHFTTQECIGSTNVRPKIDTHVQLLTRMRDSYNPPLPRTSWFVEDVAFFSPKWMLAPPFLEGDQIV